MTPPSLFRALLAGLLLCLGGTACDALLDLTPPLNDTEADSYRSEKELFQALTAAYNVLTWSAPKAVGGGPQNCAFEVLSEILGDCCHAGGASANDAVQAVRADRFAMLSSDLYPEALWHKYFTGIYRCNKFFEKIDGARFDDEDLRACYKAEAHFLRAYFYFDLVRLFGNVPLILRPLTPADYAQRQADPAVVYGQIASDLLAEVADSGDYAFLPDAYAKDPASGVAPLWDVAHKNCSEEVFTIQYSALSKWGDWSNREGCLGNQAVVLWGLRDVGAPYATGWSFAPVAERLFEAYDPADPRRWATLINARPAEGDNDGEDLVYTPGFQDTGYFCRKFTPLAANNASVGSRELNYPNNYPAIRWADVLLMAAEMEFRCGSRDRAFGYYARVRERALGAGSAGTAGDLTLDRILDERLLELALEGHRYWDVLRQGDAYAARVLTNGLSGPWAATWDPVRRGLLPIPQYEITQSRNALVQNPGY